MVEAEIGGRRRRAVKKRSLDFVEMPSSRKKRRSGPRGWPTKFQGTWDSTLGTLFVIGNEGFYGQGLRLPVEATKFLKNITASNDEINIRGTWKWNRDHRTFGRFDLELCDNFTAFKGTWGWGRRISGGGFWAGQLQHGKTYHVQMDDNSTTAPPVPLVVTPTAANCQKVATFGPLQLQPPKAIDPGMLIYQRQMNAYTMASLSQSQLEAQPGGKKFAKTAITTIQQDISTKEVASSFEPVKEEESQKREAFPDSEVKNEETAAAAAVESTGLAMSPLVFIYSQ